MKPSIFTKLFYAYQFSYGCVLIWAVDKLLFESRGLSLVQIGLLIAIWSVFSVLFEIPTGILADKWSRKKMLSIVGVFSLLAFIVWFYSYNFWGFALGYLLLALSMSFWSGTSQAYLHDFLSIHKRTDDFEKIWGRARAFNLIGLAAAWTLGGIVSEFSYSITLIASMLSGLSTLTIGLLLPELKRLAPSQEENPFLFLKGALVYSFKHPVILRVFIFTAIVHATYGTMDEYWAIYFNWFGLKTSEFGVLVAGATILGALVSLFAYKLKKYGWKIIDLLILLEIAILGITYFYKSFFVIALLLSLEVINGVMVVLTQGLIQLHAEESKRATITSVNSLFWNIAIIIAPTFGFISQKWGIQTGYGFFGVFMMLYFIGVMLINILRNHRGTTVKIS